MLRFPSIKKPHKFRSSIFIRTYRGKKKCSWNRSSNMFIISNINFMIFLFFYVSLYLHASSFEICFLRFLTKNRVLIWLKSCRNRQVIHPKKWQKNNLTSQFTYYEQIVTSSISIQSSETKHYKLKHWKNCWYIWLDNTTLFRKKINVL